MLSQLKTIFIGLGGNRSSSSTALRQARQKLDEKFDDMQASGLLTTQPHNTDAQGPFLNQVVQFQKSSPDPHNLLYFLLTLEKKIGRSRDQSPDRLIDLDLLYIGQEIVRNQDLRVPHPRIHRRPFVLQSTVELAPKFIHPILRRTQRELLNRISN